MNYIKLNGHYPGVDEQLFDLNSERPSQLFIGLVKSYDEDHQMVMIEQRNHFSVGDRIEIFNPSGKRYEMIVKKMYDEDHQPIDVARHPQQIIHIPTDFACEKDAMVRKI